MGRRGQGKVPDSTLVMTKPAGNASLVDLAQLASLLQSFLLSIIGFSAWADTNLRIGAYPPT